MISSLKRLDESFGEADEEDSVLVPMLIQDKPVDTIIPKPALYKPEEKLANAMLDARILALAFTGSAGEAPPGTWSLQIPPDMAVKPPRQQPLLLRMKSNVFGELSAVPSPPPFILDRYIWSTKGGDWKSADNLSSDVPETFPSLASLIRLHRKILDTKSIPSMQEASFDMPEIKHYVWIGDGYLSPATGQPDIATANIRVWKENKATFDMYHNKKVSDDNISILDGLFSQPYMVVYGIESKAHGNYVLACHIDTRVWFLLHSHRDWVWASYSLSDLLGKLMRP